MGMPELRPLGVGETLDAGIKVYLRNFGMFLALTAAVVVPVSIFGLIIQWGAMPEGATVVDGQLRFPETTSFGDVGRFAALSGVSGLITLLGFVLATAASFVAAGDSYLGRTPDTGRSLSFGLKRIHSVLWVGILWIIIIMACFILAIIPILGWFGAPILVIYLLVGMSLGIPVLLFERKKGLKALNRSRELIKGRWWPSFGTLLVGLMIIPAVFQFAINLLLGITLLSGVDSVGSYMLVSWVGDTIALLLTVPYSAVVITVLYIDTRVRKEGLDLQLRAKAMDTPEGAPASYAGTTQQPPPSSPA